MQISSLVITKPYFLKLGQLKRQGVYITLEDHIPIFKCFCEFIKVKWASIQTQIAKVLNASLVELFKGEYALNKMCPCTPSDFIEF
jgi:predicted transcriptional regulator